MDKVKEAVGGLSSSPVLAMRYNNSSISKYEVFGRISALIKPGSSLLDIGCGSGFVLKMLRDSKRLKVVGIEPQIERASAAADQGLEVINGIFSPDIADKYGRFDYILFADVLEHLVDPAQTLLDVKAALAPNGRVLASIPNIAHWTVRLKLLLGKFDYQPTGIMDATHLRWFTRKSVCRLFEASGFEVEHLHATAGGWLTEYRFTPLRLLSMNQRSFVLGQICRIAPGLFSVQHIVSARIRGA